MSVSIWTDALAFLGAARFNRSMRRFLPFVALLVGIVGIVWAMDAIRSGPDVTGPVDNQVRVEDVPNPAETPIRGTFPSTTNTSSPVVTVTVTTEEDIWALPEGFRQLLDRDAIAPIYDPVYTTAEGSTWPDDALVIGLEINGDARAYPIGYLNRREMVIDTVGDIPVLVSW